MKLGRTLSFACTLFLASAVAPALQGQEEKKVGTEKRANGQVEKTPVADLRARFSEPEADTATLGITAGELIMAGDQAWLRERLLDPNLPETAVLAIVSAFPAKNDTAALPEILTLSITHQQEGVRKACRKAQSAFLENGATRAVTIDRLLKICTTEKNPSKDLILAALAALGAARELTAVDVLIPYTTNGDPRLAQQALDSLKVLTYRDFGADSEAWKNWWAANRHLSRDRLIEDVMKKEIEELRSEKGSLSDRYISLALKLIQISPEQAVHFIGEGPEISRSAAQAISEHASEEWVTGVLDRVIAHLDQGEDDVETLKPLLEVLGGERANRPEAQALLIKYLRDDPRDGIKAKAARSLQAFKNNEVRGTVTEMLAELRSEKGRVDLKGQLLDLLAALGPPMDLELIAPFVLMEHDASVRGKAVKALGATADQHAIALLNDVQKRDPEIDVRFEVQGSLAQLGESSPQDTPRRDKAIQALQQGLLDRDSRVRTASVRALTKLAPPNSLEIFRGHLVAEEDERVRIWCIRALGKIRNPDGLAVICEALPDNSTEEAAKKEIFEKAREAVSEICGDDLGRWMAASEIFFNKGYYVLANSFCEQYLTRAKDTNGADGSITRMRVLKADTLYQLYLKTQELPKALEQAKILADLDPENNHYLHRYARILVETADLQNALAAYRSLLARFPQDRILELWEIKVEAAECMLTLKDPGGSARILQDAPAPDSGVLSKELSQRILEAKRKAQAALGEKEPTKTDAEAGGKPGQADPSEKTGQPEPSEKTGKPEEGGEGGEGGEGNGTIGPDPASQGKGGGL